MTDENAQPAPASSVETTIVRTLKLSGMTCGACEKIIERAIRDNGGEVNEVDAQEGIVKFRATVASAEAIRETLARKGFRESVVGEERGDPARVTSYIRSVIAGEPHVELENTLLNYSIAVSAVLLVAGGSLYGTMQEAFGSPVRTASLLVFIIAAAVLSAYSFAHMSAYRKWMSCTNGMMVGMTTGMASGYMVGAILGATNGMFIGSVGGMAVGIAMGLSLGRHSGIMGAMEGLMAGLMSGTMGAMTTVMMVNDNLIAFMYIIIAICAVTIGGLSYMMFREAGPAPKGDHRIGIAVFAWIAISLSAAMILIIFYGPKSGITLR